MPRYALITGASSGIGLAMAEALARRGRHLLLVARQRDVLESVASELTQRFGVEVLFRYCDLAEPLQVSGLLMDLEQGEREIDLLVNNAGIGTSGAFVDQDWGREQELIEVNILALARLCHGIGGLMARQGGGRGLARPPRRERRTRRRASRSAPRPSRGSRCGPRGARSASGRRCGLWDPCPPGETRRSGASRAGRRSRTASASGGSNTP